jgi:NitT/TauT family transport system ATP-binding protein
LSKVIELKAAQKTYPGVEHPSLHQVDLVVVKGEFVVLIGPSGCGKSTLIKLVTGLEEASSGTVERPETAAMVFQSGALFPWMTVAGNVEIVLQAKGLGLGPIKRKVRTYLEMVDLQSLADKYPRELSGGQRQRVGIARALAVDPEVLVLDEPFAALDIKTTEMLHQDILSIWEQTKQTIMMVSHSIEEAVTLADRIILMNAGRVVRSYNLADMPRPRREQAESFIHQVQAIRRDFLALGE